MDEYEFERRFGRQPLQDDMHRANCVRAGQPGHWGCGVCRHDRLYSECIECLGERAGAEPPLAEVGSVVQLDPQHCDWGAVFVIVTEVHNWHVGGYFLVPETRGEPPGRAFIRVSHGHYAVIGRAKWTLEP